MRVFQSLDRLAATMRSRRFRRGEVIFHLGDPGDALFVIVSGDVKISLADVELLTIKIRLIICSVDKAEKIGMDWWRADPYFSSAARDYAARLFERKGD